MSIDAARAKRRVPGWTYRLAIAAAVLLAVTGALKWTPLGEQIDAWLHPASTTPVPLPVPPTHEETPQEKAQKLREMALVEAQKSYVGEALDELAAANVLDPDGACSKPAVDAGMAIPHYAKPPTGPDERPLIRKNHPLHLGRTGVSLERRGVSLGMTAVSLVMTGVVTRERGVALGMTGVLHSETVVLGRETPVVTREAPVIARATVVITRATAVVARETGVDERETAVAE